MNISRRRFLSGAAATGAAGAAAAGGILGNGSSSGAQDVSYPFHGPHQAGILIPAPNSKQPATCVVAFDTITSSRAQLAALFQTLTSRARFLTAGGTPPNLGAGQPPSDSDVLGPVVPADGLTVTVSAGAPLFDGRYGLAPARPAKLTVMPVFPDDSPDPAWLGGDLLIQFCANHADTVHHALRDIMKHTMGGMQMRWKIEGYSSPPRPSGTPRNLLGFKDGTADPAGQTASSLAWVDGTAEPSWTCGGSYVVVRIIRMLVEFWDRVSISEQQGMIGRFRDSGAPLDGNTEFAAPDYQTDPAGNVIPLNAHIRLANPRTPGTADQRLIRRSYNYDLGVDLNGNMQAGHIFICYQQDIQRQFETVQNRLNGEPLTDYVQPFGGGYFFTLPGVRNASDWYGRAMLG